MQCYIFLEQAFVLSAWEKWMIDKAKKDKECHKAAIAARVSTCYSRVKLVSIAFVWCVLD